MADVRFSGTTVLRGISSLVVAFMVVLAAAAYSGGAYAQAEGGDDVASDAEPGDGAQTFDTSFTDRTVSEGNKNLGNCRRLPEKERIECVAEALRAVARRLSQRADYFPVARIFRQTADRVEAAKTISVAVKILTVAKKSVLRAYGDKSHLEKLATLMDTAKSVLRS